MYVLLSSEKAKLENDVIRKYIACIFGFKLHMFLCQLHCTAGSLCILTSSHIFGSLRYILALKTCICCCTMHMMLILKYAVLTKNWICAYGFELCSLLWNMQFWQKNEFVHILTCAFIFINKNSSLFVNREKSRDLQKRVNWFQPFAFNDERLRLIFCF